MKNNFRLSLSRNPNGIAFSLFGATLPEAGKKLVARQVPIPGWAPELMDELRQGNPKFATIQTVKDIISQWLLGSDLEPYLDAAINNLNPANKEKLRLIFNVDRELYNDLQLGGVLADLPFELLVLTGDIAPLVVSPKISAFVHLLDKVAHASASSTQRTPPLRVLIVHSNPKDLGAAVPNPIPIRQEILKLGNQPGLTLVQIDVLSRQVGEGVVGLPTAEGLYNQLHTTPLPYDILVYLGHGDQAQYREDVLPLGMLFLESPDGNQGVPYSGDRLAIQLQDHPIPVVLLVGCLTAAEIPPADRDGILQVMPRAMRGSQGVAQALVNSGSGVQVAVGMRYRLESEDARQFLITFFNSLLKQVPGDTEAAVRSAREKLFAISPPHLPNWAAPVIFRALREEPMFDYLVSQNKTSVYIDEKDQAIRAVFWEQLRNLSWSKASPEPLTAMSEALRGIELKIVQDIRQKAPLIMPEWQLGQREQIIQLPILFYGQLDVDELEGSLILDGEGVTIEKVNGAPAVKAAYRVLTEIEGNKFYFQIRRRLPGNGSLPEGPLMVADLKLGSATSVTYPVSISALASNPVRTICPGNNAIIVPAP